LIREHTGEYDSNKLDANHDHTNPAEEADRTLELVSDDIHTAFFKVEARVDGASVGVVWHVLATARHWQLDTISVSGVVLPVTWSVGAAAVEILLNIVDHPNDCVVSVSGVILADRLVDSLQHLIVNRFLEGKHETDANQLDDEQDGDDEGKGAQHEAIAGDGTATAHKGCQKDGTADDEQNNGRAIGPIVHHQVVLVQTDEGGKASVDQQATKDDKDQVEGEQKVANTGHASLAHFGVCVCVCDSGTLTVTERRALRDKVETATG